MNAVDAQRTAFHEWLQLRDPTQPPEILETHISFVALQGDRVLKLKKAIAFRFVDLSTAERRRLDCEREVELNRRLAPDVYLGVLPLRAPDGTLIDHVVEMRRMPATAALQHLTTKGADLGPCLRRLALQLARFHERAATGGRIDAAATRDAVRALWDRNIAELQSFAGGVLDAARLDRADLLAHRFLACRAPLFECRIEAHRARDGHGDLLAADVYCLDDGPRALDCLEFDDRLRYGDVLADVAFLAMDLERLEQASAARQFLDAYARAAHDDWPESLEHFYIAYRALVRAKIAALADTKTSTEAPEAQHLLRIALGHLARAQVRVLLIGGPPATGKTTLSRAVAARLGWPSLHSDEIRKELAGIRPARSAAAPLNSGLYAADQRQATYARMLALARERLVRGESVVLDASWSAADERDRAARVASESSASLLASTVRTATVRRTATCGATRGNPR